MSPMPASASGPAAIPAACPGNTVCPWPQLVRMFIIVVSTFAFCWLPYQVYFVYTYHDTALARSYYVQVRRSNVVLAFLVPLFFLKLFEPGRIFSQ